ncbi:hypothetical protein DB30_05858 [Enhygromyxa salina]|uniref:Uncharacterized protein n=1 Tax=Enhygromyxa salina TaxID=215803 RepID=A0A0C1ZVT1_9BACT|nr:hypothetical protein [Enhygromyxa salina]KIG15158.1 hypothetical protein DB30_05858 [Enhygromyxa salina]
MSTRAKHWPLARGVMLCLLWLPCVLSSGCRVGDPSMPVDGHRELCCRAASPDNVSFVGCRATNYCRTNEEVWVRGPVICGPTDSRACEGGRCCKLDLDDVVELDDAASPTAEPSPAPEPAVAPTPAPIRPVPFNRSATSAARAE